MKYPSRIGSRIPKPSKQKLRNALLMQFRISRSQSTNGDNAVKLSTVEEAINQLKAGPPRKFKESLDFALVLNIDPKKVREISYFLTCHSLSKMSEELLFFLMGRGRRCV
jgi:hypothetical protein